MRADDAESIAQTKGRPAEPPTVELKLTEEQRAALARGETVQLVPAEPGVSREVLADPLGRLWMRARKKAERTPPQLGELARILAECGPGAFVGDLYTEAPKQRYVAARLLQGGWYDTQYAATPEAALELLWMATHPEGAPEK